MAATVFFDFEDLDDRAWDTGFAAVLVLEPGRAALALWADFFLDLCFDEAGFVFAAGVSCAISTPAVNNATVKMIVLKGKTQHTKVVACYVTADWLAVGRSIPPADGRRFPAAWVLATETAPRAEN